MPITAEQLLDTRQLEQLKYDYCWAYDEGRIDDLVGLFAHDGVAQLGAFGTFRGASELREGYASIMAATKIPGTRRHVPSCPSFQLEGDRASGRWYLVDYRTEPGVTQPVRIFATYADDYIRSEGEWKIVQTSLQIEWQEP